MDVEKMLTELREAWNAYDQAFHWGTAHPEGRRHRERMRAAIIAFPADMPGAIGWFLEEPAHRMVCSIGSRVAPGPCDCGLAAALAKLEGK